jgi:hypothetical protein
VKANSPIRGRGNEAGIALLISIFVLLLISVVAIALIVSSGTESALAGNYRSATGVYYAALGGLEEARGRLLVKDPNSFKNTASGFLPSPGTTLAIGAVAYVLNPGPTEAMGNILTTYPDTEYDSEFGAGARASATVTTTASVWNRNPLNTLAFPPPLYKWVRINAVSEKSLNVDVDADSLADSTTELYYDGTHMKNNPSAGPQILEITSLAVLPNGSQKILQYLAAPVPLNLSFPAALTLDGHDVLFSVPTSSSFWIDGNDHDTVGSCSPVAPAIPAVGYILPPPADSSKNNILTAIPPGPPPSSGRQDHYIGAPPAPSLVQVPVSPNLQTVGGLNTLVQNISQAADKVITPTPDATGLGTATQADLPAAMNSTNPMTTVVNGNLNVSGWTGTGYGLLLVTGEFKYDPNASWYGIVLVLGVGKLSSLPPGSGVFHGAVFLAKTTNTTTSPYTPMSPPSAAPGVPNFAFTTGSGGNGIYYSSCWIQASMPSLAYTILSFHEISQP